MEQTRLLIAIAISFAVFFLWSIFFAPQPTKAPPDDAKIESTDPAVAEKPSGPEPVAQAPIAEAPAMPEIPEAAPVTPTAPEREVTVETPLYRMIFTDKGAAIKSVVLKDYRETTAKDSPLKELISDRLKNGTFLLNVLGKVDYGVEGATYVTDQTTDLLSVNAQPATLKFRHQSATGLVIEKALTFAPDSYLVDVEITLYNGSDHPMAPRLALGLGNYLEKGSGGYGFAGPSGLINGELDQVKLKKIEDKNRYEGKVRWVAIEGRYFMSSLILKEALDADMLLSYDENIVKNQIVIPSEELAPHETKHFSFNLFTGPKSLSLLKTLNVDLERAIDFGWVDFFAKPCLWFMNFIYGYIPNYGIAIIILTLVTRGMFWPLAKKSYKSMGEMRRIQPLMQEIREKYKGDKARMNQEMMTLYKTYKINPLGGCLPMVIQLPVFFALYRMLYQAIELRHAPFFGWISDLSAPDRLFSFSFKIPFMDPPYGIPVLTLIMGASMLLQQKMTPAPGDPAQAKMMMLMPIVFTFIFINFSSGLVLYWLVSNIFSMAQQYYTQKKMV